MKLTTDKGIWFSTTFTDKFGSVDVKPSKKVPSFKTLPRYMTDSEIRREFGAHECTLEDIAAFVTNPPEGTDDGNWNIFYVAGYVVRVYWDAGIQRWCVVAWELGGGAWSAGYRVFSRNWDSGASAPVLGTSDALKLISEIEEELAKFSKVVGDIKAKYSV